jgi:hypothetical protein
MKYIGEPYAGNPHVRFDEGRGVIPAPTLPSPREMLFWI